MDYTDMGYMPRSLPRSLASTPGRRSAFGDSVHSLASEGNSVSMSRAAGNARSFSQRSSRSHALDIAIAEREMLWDSNMHIVPRKQPWNNHHRGHQVSWHTHTSYDQLNWNLEPHPYWVAKAPGAFGAHFERNLLYEPPQTSPFRSWDSRHLVANVLSSDPVIDGQRLGLDNRRGVTVNSASPTRRYIHR